MQAKTTCLSLSISLCLFSIMLLNVLVIMHYTRVPKVIAALISPPTPTITPPRTSFILDSYTRINHMPRKWTQKHNFHQF